MPQTLQSPQLFAVPDNRPYKNFFNTSSGAAYVLGIIEGSRSRPKLF